MERAEFKLKLHMKYEQSEKIDQERSERRLKRFEFAD